MGKVGGLFACSSSRGIAAASRPTCLHAQPVLYARGTVVVIRRSAETQMQRTSMFLLKLFRYFSCWCFVERGYRCASPKSSRRSMQFLENIDIKSQKNAGAPWSASRSQ
jgi:hypothetical protein